MPSPIGHALGGMACGWLAGGRAPHWKKQAALFGALGALPDLDFLFGTHSTYSHSIGACAAVLVIAGLAATDCSRRWRVAVAAAAAYGSHVLLDWLGSDTTPPIGILALWPITGGYYQSDLHWFLAIRRQYWLDTFWADNLRAIAWEIILLGPAAALAWRWRTLPRRRRAWHSLSESS